MTFEGLMGMHVGSTRVEPGLKAAVQMIPLAVRPKETPFTGQEVIDWLNTKEASFMTALEKFGRKIGYGFEKNRVGHIGEFTGEGLCGYAIGILEEVLRARYGQDIKLAEYTFITDDMDIDAKRKKTPRIDADHHFIRFNIRGDSTIYTLDATYRQFQIRHGNKKFLIIPSADEGRYYTFVEKHKRAQYNDPKKVFYSPLPSEPGALFRKNIENIQGKRDECKKVTVADYMELFRAFAN